MAQLGEQSITNLIVGGSIPGSPCLHVNVYLDKTEIRHHLCFLSITIPPLEIYLKIRYILFQKGLAS